MSTQPIEPRRDLPAPPVRAASAAGTRYAPIWGLSSMIYQRAVRTRGSRLGQRALVVLAGRVSSVERMLGARAGRRLLELWAREWRTNRRGAIVKTAAAAAAIGLAAFIIARRR